MQVDKTITAGKSTQALKPRTTSYLNRDRRETYMDVLSMLMSHRMAKRLKIFIMTSIINKVNEITNDNFTKLVKARKNAGACFLIVALANGGAIYGSYTSSAVYYINEIGDAFGFRR